MITKVLIREDKGRLERRESEVKKEAEIGVR